MSRPADEQLTGDAEVLCLAARERAAGGPLGPDEISHYLALMHDERTAPDPNDPPSYDWTGGPPLAGGSTMQVRATAVWTLKKCGGDALVDELKARFLHTDDSADRAHYAGVVAEVLGYRHALLLAWLGHEAADIRESTVRGIATFRGDGYKHLDVIAPLLADGNDAVMAQAIAAIKNVGFWVAPLPPGTLPASLLQRASDQLRLAAPAQQPLRRQSLIYLSILTGNWKMLASAAISGTPEDLRQLAGMECFNKDVLDEMLSAEPSLRDAMRPAIFAGFSQRWGYRDMGLLCCFAPDREALELALPALRVNTAAAWNISKFVQCDPACMPAIVDAAFQNPKRNSSDATGFQSLVLSNPEAFAQALAAAPATLDARLKKLRDTLECCLPRADVDQLMSQVNEPLARLKPGKPTPNEHSPRAGKLPQ